MYKDLSFFVSAYVYFGFSSL